MDRRGVRTEHAVSGPTPGEPKGAEESARVQAGQLIGRYRLLFPIAAGGMAEVWAAKPEGTGISRAVALKLVRPEFAVEAEYARMFIDEAVVASAIRHPNICETYELGRDENLLFMVMEWVAGDTLSGLMRGSALTRLPLEIAVRICSEACAGLHAAHDAKDGDGNSLGIVHRDISPPNILVSVNGHVKVSDFGIAKAANQLHARTRTGEIKGKLAYIPPEQVLGHGVDRRVDIYAMGCVLYVCTLGRRPFGSGGEALGKIVRGLYHKPRELDPAYPEELERIVMRALASDREQRYQTAEEMRFELEQWLLSRPKPTQHGDVARLVRERISDDRRKMIDALVNVSRAIPDALAHRFISPADKTATPTATSGIVIQPAALARLKDPASAPTLTPPVLTPPTRTPPTRTPPTSTSPTRTPPMGPADEETTQLSDAARAALTPPKAAEASVTGAQSRRRPLMPWAVALAAVVFALFSLYLFSRR